ncbi:MAG TPA: tetratricopeptide repeat protein [Polyangia bacterium]|nr:tetratricopeptide repeat protein [Polyangia bacterium]
MKTVLALAIALVSVAGIAAPARGTDKPGDATAVKLSEAEQRFRRGIELYKDGDFGAALAEFKRAYALMPSYKILYNLGQVSYQRHDYAAALRYFRQYLADGDDAIPDERRHEVAGAILDLESRVGRLEIESGDEGAEVFIDDTLIGTTPLQALTAVNAGRRKIDVVTRNGEHRTRLIDVAGGEVVPLSFPRLGPRPADKGATHATDPKTVSLAARNVEPAAAAAAPAIAPAATVSATATAPVTASTSARKARFPWKSWTLTGLLAGGAATTGVIALRSKHDLDSQLNMFPQDASEVDYDRRKTRGFALATDGLLIGTALMTAISFYLTFRDPG